MPTADHPDHLAARLDRSGEITMRELHEALDALDDAGRLRFTRALDKRRQLRLWDLCERHMEASLAQIVPDDVPPMTPVVFEGRNSMAMFNLFQKRFVRAPAREQLWGYNHQTWAWVTGPGYFVVEADPDHVELLFDYVRLPEQVPDGWPAVRANTGLLAGPTYGEMIDLVRAVSRDLLIGKVMRHGKPRGQYFTLCRASGADVGKAG